MKTIVIMQDVSVPKDPDTGRGMPKFKKGQEVRVSDRIADMLTERGLAKENKGKSRAKVKADKKKDNKEEKPEVEVSKQ